MTDLNALMIFAKVVEAKSFSEAARRLAMPVSTVSRRVADLETELGARLLVRSTRNVRLTEAGSEVIQHARKSAEVSDAVDRLMASKRMDGGTAAAFGSPQHFRFAAGAARRNVPARVSRHSRESLHLRPDHGRDVRGCGPGGQDRATPRHRAGRAEDLDLPPPTRRQPRLPPSRDAGRDAAGPARPPSARVCVSRHREQLDLHRNRRAGQGDAAVPSSPVDERLCGPDLADAGGQRHRRSTTRGASRTFCATDGSSKSCRSWTLPVFDLSLVHPVAREISRPMRAFKDFAARTVPTLFPDLPH